MATAARIQHEFAAAARDPDRRVPETLGSASGRRFAVYRNNVSVSLATAVATRFPVVRRIVGDEFFAWLAGVYVSAHPPASPVMMTYGDDFPGFIGRAGGLEELPYLADVARLEAARTRAYHAEDAPPLGPAAFGALRADLLDRTGVVLTPSVELVRSAHPIVTIWAMNAGESELRPIDDWRAEDALVSRPAMDVLIRRLPPGAAEFLAALGAGLTLVAAAEASAARHADFDLTLALAGLISAGAAVALAERQPSGDRR